jgi:uncharacterized protein YjgD (DUF1641 family)
MNQDKLDKINRTLERVATGVAILQEDSKEIKSDVKYNRENIETLLSNQDWMIGQLTKLDQERLATIQTLREHTKRIERLEVKLGLVEA